MDLPRKPPIRDSQLTTADVPAAPSPVVPESAGIMPPILPTLPQLVTHADLATLSPIIANTVTDCDSLVKDIADRINNAARACAVQCADSIDQCCACITAKAGITAEQAYAVLSKCQGKISKAVSTSYDATIGSVLSVGCVFPTADVVSAIASGVGPVDAYAGSGQVQQTTPGVDTGNASLPVDTTQVLGQVQTISPSGSASTSGDGLASTLSSGRSVPTIQTGGPGLPIPIAGPACPAGYSGPYSYQGCTICIPDPLGPIPAAPIVKLVPSLDGSINWQPALGTDCGSTGTQSVLIPQPPGFGGSGEFTLAGVRPAVPPTTPKPPPASPPPAVPPPASPPPAKPPPTTGGGLGGITIPPPPPPTLVDGTCCYEPRPAHLVGCGETAITPPPPQIWITCDPECGSSKIRYCIYAGDTPPVVPKGTILRGPFPDVATAQSACTLPVTICGTGTGGGTGIGSGSGGTAGTGSTGGPGTDSGPPDTGSGSGTGQGSGSGSGLDCVSPGTEYCSPSTLSAAFAYTCQQSQQTMLTPGKGGTSYADKWQIQCGWFPSFSNQVCDGINTAAKKLGQLVDQVFAFAGCTNSSFGTAAANGLIINLVEHWTGVVPAAIVATNRQQQNLACQYIVPDTATFNGMYVRGFIDQAEWQSGVAINGHCIPFQRQVVEAEYVYPSVSESIALYLRGQIDRPTLDQWCRRQGVKDSTWVDQLLRLAIYVRTTEESTFWRQRATDSDDTAKTLSLDDGFDQWWNDDGQAIATAHGIDQDTVRQRYRAAWRLPDITTALECFRRIKETINIPGMAVPAKPVDTSELSALALASGMPDGWASRIAAVSYAPIGLRHIRLAYVTGVIPRDQLASRFELIGFSPDDSQIQAEAFANSARDQLAKYNGLPSQSEILGLYRDDAISQDDATGLLTSIGIEQDKAENIVATADEMRDARQRKQTLAAIKRRYLIGDYTEIELRQSLLQAGIDAGKLDRIVSAYQLQLSLKVKEASVGQLCEWFTRGYIDASTYVRRLTNLGYTSVDATNIVSGCQWKIDDKTAKELVKAAKEARKAEAKAAAASRPCKDRPKPYCGVDMKYVRSFKTDRTGAKGPKTTETDTTTATSEGDGVTVVQKEEIIS